MAKATTVIIGIILALVGLWLILPLGFGFFSGAAWSQFLTLLIGTIPALLVLIGILMIWV